MNKEPQLNQMGQISFALNYYSGTEVSTHTNTVLTNSGTGVLTDSKGLPWKWNFTCETVMENGREGLDLKLSATLQSGKAEGVNLSLEFLQSPWTVENFLLIPGAAYNGNRYESRRIGYPPMLVDPADIRPDAPIIINDIPRLEIGPGPSRLHIRSGDASIPAIGYFSPAQNEQRWWLTNQSSGWGDHGLRVEENEDRTQATIAFETPGVRRGKSFNLMPLMKDSTDVPATVEAGQTLSLHVRFFGAKAQSVQDLYNSLVVLRNSLTPPPQMRHELPFSKSWELLEKKHNEQNFQFGKCYAGTGDAHMSAWQPGWTGHGMSSQAFLAGGSSPLSHERALKTIDFAFAEGLGPSGYFYGFYSQSRGYYGDHFHHHDWPWHLNRKSADMLYFGIRQFDLLKKQNPAWKCPESWEKGVRRVAEAFIKTWDQYGQLGQFVDHNTGEIIVGGSTAGSTAPAGLALASQWFKEPRYLEYAEKIAQKYCEEDLAAGVTTGGPGEILQAADSESLGNLLESLVVLYEVTGNEKWIQQARIAATQLVSWFVPYDYQFPPESTYGKLDMLTTGTIFASTQNKCAVPGLCTLSGDSLLKLYRATGEEIWLRLLREMAHSIPQFLCRADKPIKGLQESWMSERVQMGDGIDACGEICPASCWSEVSLMFTWMEVPGLYIRTDTGLVCAFDHIDVKVESHEGSRMTVCLSNPTKFDALVKVFAETQDDQESVLGQNWWKRMFFMPVSAGQSTKFTVTDQKSNGQNRVFSYDSKRKLWCDS